MIIITRTSWVVVMLVQDVYIGELSETSQPSKPDKTSDPCKSNEPGNSSKPSEPGETSELNGCCNNSGGSV